MTGAPSTIRVEVVCALPQEQLLVALDVPPGTSAREAVERAGVVARCAGLELDSVAFGIFGKRIAPEQRLREGDRVEVLRPLLNDPKEVRRQLARQGRTMGRPANRR